MSSYTTDKRWKHTRRTKLALTPNCERCNDTATDVHHKDELGLTGPRAYDPANLEALCHSCHSRITAREGVAPRPPRRRQFERHPGIL